VGFLHGLPHHLIDAFKATLEVVNEADLLLIVLDISNPLVVRHNDAIWDVLRQLRAQEKPVLYVLNKIDSVDNDYAIERFSRVYPESVAVSAKHSRNIDKLLQAIENHLTQATSVVQVFLKHPHMKLLHMIHEQGKVLHCEYKEDGVVLKARLPIAVAKKLLTEI
jgi:GTP-binding protein HflX